LTLLIVLFLTLGLTAAFGEIVLEPTYAAEATLTLGVDLNDMNTGFANDGSASVLLKFLEGDSIEKGADAAVYGMISVTNINWALKQNLGVVASTEYNDSSFDAAGDVMTLEAKVMADPLWVTIYAGPGMAFDWAADVEGADDGVEVDYPAGGGVTIGLDTEMVDLTLYSASEYVWDVNTYNGYSLGALVSAVLGPATVEAYGIMGKSFSEDDDIGFGASVDLTVAAAGIDIVPALDVDAAILKDDGMATQEFAFEIAGGVDVNLTYDADDAAATFIALDASFSDPDTEGDFDLSLGITESQDDGLIPNLAATLTLTVYDMMNAMAGKIAATGSYNIDGIKPGFEVGFDEGVLDPTPVAYNDTFDLKVYVEVTGLVPNTTFTLAYESDQLLDGQVDAAITSQDLGDITLATKIAY
jgi:hypothetical protein